MTLQTSPDGWPSLQSPPSATSNLFSANTITTAHTISPHGSLPPHSTPHASILTEAPTVPNPAAASQLSQQTAVSHGTRIDSDHKNFVLMYDMLTGIRIAVSRNQAKASRPLTSSDFKSAHKLAFDITGNELTPSSKYDFKFKDYSPWVFRELRELFKIDAAEYLISLTGRYVLSEQVTSGKSGSFFYYSQDYRFIIKTIHHSEHLYLRKILSAYYHHVKAFPNTLLSRFIGLHLSLIHI